MHLLYNKICFKVKSLEDYIVSKVKIMTNDLYKVLVFKDDDMRRIIFDKMIDNKIMVYNDIENKTKQDKINALKHCAYNDAYELYKKLPSSYDYELALSENLDPKTVDKIYNEFVFKENEDIIVNVIKSTPFNISGTTKLVDTLVNSTNDLSDRISDELIKYLKRKTSPYIATPCDKLKQLILDHNIDVKYKIVFKTDHWKRIFLNHCINKKQITPDVVEHCMSIIDNDSLNSILQKIHDKKTLLIIYKSMDVINEKNMRLIINKLGDTFCEYIDNKRIQKRKHDGTLYKLFKHLGPKRISGYKKY